MKKIKMIFFIAIRTALFGRQTVAEKRQMYCSNRYYQATFSRLSLLILNFLSA